MQDYNIPGYIMHSTNLESDAGRGIAVYIHSSIVKSTIQIESHNNFNEVCLLKIKLHGGDNLLFGCFYRSPTPSKLSDSNNTNLNNLLRFLSNKHYSHLCFVGDFNYKDIDWLTWTTSHNEESKEAKFIETIRDCYLYQHLLEPTRRRGSDNPSLIDLLFTNEALQVSDVEYHAPLGKSDHCILIFKYSCYLDYSRPKSKYIYHKADFDMMKSTLNISNWKNTFLGHAQSKSVDELWIELKMKLHELRDEFVPTRIAGEQTWTEKGNIPISKALRNAIRNKRISHRKWMVSKEKVNSESAHLNYTKARNKVKSMMRNSKRSFERQIGQNSIKNPKAFWSYVRKNLKTKTGVAPLLQNNADKESIKFKDKDKADILQQQFVSVFTHEPTGDIPTLTRKSKSNLIDINISKEMVRKEILKLGINKSCGPDGIHPRLLLELVDYVSEPLSLIFNKTILTGHLPEDWKTAYVSPIFKKGPRNRAENYRPISLTSIICKLIESIIKESIMNHLRVENLLSSKQYGFINGRSTTTQLLSYLSKCIDTIAAGGVVDTIYFDFAKAFDTVPHQRLIKKLKAYGINGNILNWITAFLTNRTQIVKVNGTKSYPASVLSGIPQGSVLGPILFILYINDLPDEISSEAYLYADDTKIFRQIMKREDAILLQSDIHQLELWSKKWLLQFHPKKCTILTLGKFNNIRYTHRYNLNDCELEHVFMQKDLGVIIDFDLKFEEHISAKVKVANAMVGLIRRSFSFLDGTLFRKLYTSFVRPHLEYAQVVWAPFLQKHINIRKLV